MGSVRNGRLLCSWSDAEQTALAVLARSSTPGISSCSFDHQRSVKPQILAFAKAIVIHTSSFGKPKRRKLMFALVGAILGLIAAATIFLFIPSSNLDFSAGLILMLILSLGGAILGRFVDLMKS